MAGRLRPGPPATRADRQRAADRVALLRTEVSRIRAAAVAWRNGLAGLLAALAGFSLIKGRSDIGQLASPAAVAVGVLLAVAAALGVAAALLLLRAAHGNPAVTPTSALHPQDLADHLEARESARALIRGRALLIGCAAVLAAAVAVTWYSPPRTRPVQVATETGTVCGPIVRLSRGDLTLRTGSGEITTPLARAESIKVVDACAPG